MGTVLSCTMNVFLRAIATTFIASAIMIQVATSQTSFTCESGCGSVVSGFVGDGYCDCDDCSDESSWTCNSCGNCPSCSEIGGSSYVHCSSRRRQGISGYGASAPTITTSFDWSLIKSWSNILADTTVTIVNQYGITTEDQESMSTEIGIGNGFFDAFVGSATSSVTTHFTFHERTESISLQAGDAGFCRWQLVASVSGYNCAGSSYTANDRIPFDVFQDTIPPCNSKPSASYTDGYNNGTVSMCGASGNTACRAPPTKWLALMSIGVLISLLCTAR